MTAAVEKSDHAVERLFSFAFQTPVDLKELEDRITPREKPGIRF